MWKHSSPLWQQLKILSRKANMRAELFGEQTSTQISKFLLTIVAGNVPLDKAGEISLSQICSIVNTVYEVNVAVFHDLTKKFGNISLCKRAILAPKNKCYNNQWRTEMPSMKPSTYKSIDTVADRQEVVHDLVEFPKSLNPSGQTTHGFQDKIRAPLMLLRTPELLMFCNGTRLVAKKPLPHIIEATILAGCSMDSSMEQEIFITRIPLSSSYSEIYVPLWRLSRKTSLRDVNQHSYMLVLLDKFICFHFKQKK